MYQEYVNQLSTQLATGEEELPTDEELARQEDKDDWAYDESIGN
jgi:hypothetical protein